MAGYPDEVCGLLGGRWQGDEGRVKRVMPLPNVASNPHIRYQVEQKAFVDAYRQIERRGDELIGIYHSHPTDVAVPSATDLAEATWPDVAYLIIGLREQSSPDIRAWSIKRGTATPVTLVQTTIADSGD